jgi:HPt (histidine-containing phosphotransfer) domain-containing protein
LNFSVSRKYNKKFAKHQLAFCHSDDILLENLERKITMSAYSEYLPHLDVADGLKRVMNNVKLYGRLLGKLNTRQMTAAILDAIESGDHEKIAQAAHALRGVTSNLGMPPLQQVADAVELAAKNGEPCGGFTDELKQLTDEFESVAATFLKNFS